MIEALRARKRMNDAVRRFFDARGFLEVETPIAVVSPGLEPHLAAFEIAGLGYLHTSPEYAMKGLLGAGVGHIYQLARVFRDEPPSRTHMPEFTMLEWYRAPGGIAEIMDDTEALVKAVASAVDGPWRPAGFERLSVTQAFLRAGLPDPIALLGDVEAFRLRVGLRTAPDDAWDDVFHRAMLERVEKTFDPARPTLLYGYPSTMAALARVDPADPRRALRFELYAGPLELANAFDELTDPVEQRRRFEDDLATRRALRRAEYPIDEALLAALPKIGPAAGIALGLDRLLMLCLGAGAIQSVTPGASSSG